MNAEMSIIQMLFFAFVGGLILNAMPCVFPMLGIKLLSIVKKAGASKATIRLSGIVYTLGIVVSFLAFAGLIVGLKSAGQQVGWGFQLQSPIFVAALAVLFTLLALNFLGYFEIAIPSFFIPQSLDRKDGLIGEFFAGVMVALVASPCTAPFMATALGYALSQSAIVIYLTFAFLGLGLGAPFLLLTIFPSLAAKLPKPGGWMITLRQFFAFPLLLTVVWLLWVFAKQTDVDRASLLLVTIIGFVFTVWVYKSIRPRSPLISILASLVLALGLSNVAFNAIIKKVDRAEATTGRTNATDMVESHGVTWHKFTRAKVKELADSGKTVFVDFTAAWCITCQANATAIFSSSEVLGYVKNTEDLELVLADWTDENEEITLALAEHGRSGVPLYLVYKPGREVAILPQILTPGIFLDALKN